MTFFYAFFSQTHLDFLLRPGLLLLALLVSSGGSFLNAGKLWIGSIALQGTGNTSSGGIQSNSPFTNTTGAISVSTEDPLAFRIWIKP